MARWIIFAFHICLGWIIGLYDVLCMISEHQSLETQTNPKEAVAARIQIPLIPHYLTQIPTMIPTFIFYLQDPIRPRPHYSPTIPLVPISRLELVIVQLWGWGVVVEE